MIIVLDADRLHNLLCIPRWNSRLPSNCIFPRDGLNENVRYLRKSKQTILPHADEVHDHVDSSEMTNDTRLLGIAKRIEDEMTSIGTMEMPS